MSLLKKEEVGQRRESHGLLSSSRHINPYIPRKNTITRAVSLREENHQWYCIAIKEVVLSSQRSNLFVSLQVETAITSENLKEWTSSSKMEERKIKVYLPRMKIEEKYNFTSVLKSLGITDLFSSSANLSGISPAESLKVSGAFHQAFVEIHEAGRKVEGSSGAEADDTRDVSEEIRVDHPFLFWIKHNPSDSIWFFGRCFSP